jgi:hypothetical protein
VRAAAISTLSGSHTTKPSLHHRRNPCGISGSGIPANQLLLRFYTIFLSNVIRLMTTLALLVVWASILVYLSAILLPTHIFPFKLCIQMFGLPLFIVIQVTNTMLFSLMTTHIIYGQCHCEISLTFFRQYALSSNTFRPNFVFLFYLFRQTMAVSTTRMPCACFCPLSAFSYGSHALTPRNRTGKPNASCVLLMIV